MPSLVHAWIIVMLPCTVCLSRVSQNCNVYRTEQIMALFEMETNRAKILTVLTCHHLCADCILSRTSDTRLLQKVNPGKPFLIDCYSIRVSLTALPVPRSMFEERLSGSVFYPLALS